MPSSVTRGRKELPKGSVTLGNNFQQNIYWFTLTCPRPMQWGYWNRWDSTYPWPFIPEQVLVMAESSVIHITGWSWNVKEYWNNGAHRMECLCMRIISGRVTFEHLYDIVIHLLKTNTAECWFPAKETNGMACREWNGLKNNDSCIKAEHIALGTQSTMETHTWTWSLSLNFALH